MGTKITITGTRELERQLRAAADDILREVQPLVTEAARETLSKSQTLVPVETGALKASGRMDPAEIRHGTTVSARVEYTHPFAAQIHEGYFGSKKRSPAPPKFLRNAAKTVKAQFQERLQSFLQSFVSNHFKEK